MHCPSLSRLTVHRSVRDRCAMSGGWRMPTMMTAVRMVDMDPELEAFVPLFPRVEFIDPAADRRNFTSLATSVPAPEIAGMEIEDRMIPADPDVPVRIYRPRLAQGAIVWMHGGGFVMGNVDTEHPWAVRLADGSGALVISVGYRLAPEDPYPAALDDVCAVVGWVHDHADEFGVDRERIAIGGHSAGGALAAAACLRTRDEDGPPICLQLLNQPGLDDRQETWSARNFTDTPWIYRAKVTRMWRHYLGSTPATAYAAPARAADLSNLPPAYIATAELCPGRDEGLLYGMRLLEAGVPTEVHQWAGTFHGSQAIMTADVSQRQLAEIAGTVRRAVGGDGFAPVHEDQWPRGRPAL